MSELADLQQQWIDLFWQMKSSAELDSSFLAAPFLSVEPKSYDPARKTILYVGKATGGDWALGDFEKNPSRDSRRAFTTRFIEEKVVPGEYNSPFWNFAWDLSNLVSARPNHHPFENIVWSNIAKIGVTKGNPERRYLAFQYQLARETLAAEIKFYGPSLLVLPGHFLRQAPSLT